MWIVLASADAQVRMASADAAFGMFCFLVCLCFFAAIAAYIGAMRGHPWLGGLMGLLFGPLGILIACVLPRDPYATRQPARYRRTTPTPTWLDDLERDDG